MDFSKVTLAWYVDGESVDEIEVELNTEEQKAYKKAIMTNDDFSSFPVLEELLDRKYEEANEEFLADYVREQMTISVEMPDPSEYEDEDLDDCDFSFMTLYYTASFGKGDGSEVLDYDVDLTDDQQEAFIDAIKTGNDVCDYPELEQLLEEAEEAIYEIEAENFVDEMELNFPDIDDLMSELSEDEINEYIKECIQHNDFETVDEVIDIQGDEYLDYALEIAEKLGCREFIENHMES